MRSKPSFMPIFKRSARLTAAAALAIAAASCKPAAKYLEKVTFDINPELSRAQVALVFTDKVRSNFAADFAIKDYGNLFTTPFSEGVQPFRAGFDLNLAVLMDNDFIQMAPTTTLPNGMPLGTGGALVQVDAGSLGGGSAEFFGYVDIRELKWLGMASMVRLVDDNFPADLVLSQVFLRDSSGNPAVFASFFGPKLNTDGSVSLPGGFALFANTKALFAAQGGRSGPIELRPESELQLSGPAAAHYRANPAELVRLGELWSRALNELR
jgi:hypothetical protein